MASSLTFNMFLVLLFCLSFIIEVKDMGAIAFVFLLAFLICINLVYFRFIYVSKGRFERIIIENYFLCYIGAIAHFFFSLLTFPIGIYLLLEGIV
jgi:hypothetical protein